MNPKLPGRVEFIVLTAFLTSITALAIDAMLPALPEIATTLGVADPNHAQLIISVLFMGLAVGQIVFGPISDSTGRKPLIYAGLGLFILGSAISMFSTNFTIMLLGRFLQGLGAASTRVITMALVRDCFVGRAMAQIMSFTMMVFILVPALAPALGQLVIYLAGWRAIFMVFILLALLVCFWFVLRMPETLPREKRIPFTWQEQREAIISTLKDKHAMIYSVISGVIFGAFMGYLNSVQQVLQVQYALGSQFPLYFAITALAVGVASFVNAKLVLRLGMRLLSRRSLIVMTVLSTLFLVMEWLSVEQPPLWVLMPYLIVLFFCVGLLFGNLNALAMETLDKYVGMGASIVGTVSNIVAIPLGTWIGQSYNGTVQPLVIGFTTLSAVGLLLMIWVESLAKPMPKTAQTL
ncbi:multidrug effflux MFS transporter [Thiolinea disciformis]|uniref:multidrug effflux MFS transporter n=1 Tax=Thiolinea disciformis TaxID=125614 RepID=UPI00036E8FF9|nr:multidrug effflux MFS transporter [Thiolinea disciformis]